MKKEIFIFKFFMLGLWISFLAILLLGYVSIDDNTIINSSKMTTTLYILLIIYTISYIPFSIFLFHINKLLNHNNIDKLCTNNSISSLNIMKKCSILMIILHSISLLFFYIIGEVDDAPGVILVGIALVSIPLLLLSITSFIKKIIIMQNKNS